MGKASSFVAAALTLCVATAFATMRQSRPVAELTLALGTKAIRAGESPTIRIALKNNGREPFFIANDIFTEPERLRSNCLREYGTFLEAVGPDGKLEVAPHTASDEYMVADSSSAYHRAVVKQVEAWKRDGLSRDEINRRLRKWEPNLPASKPKTIDLRSGKSAAFPASGSRFKLVDVYRFTKPGLYRLRAIYDKSVKAAVRPLIERSSADSPEEIRVESPWVELQVVP